MLIRRVKRSSYVGPVSWISTLWLTKITVKELRGRKVNPVWYWLGYEISF